MRALFCPLVVLAACQTGLSVSDDSGARDLRPSGDLAGQPAPDLASLDLASPDLAKPGGSSVQCGAANCVAPTSVCCRASPYGAGTCIQPGGACTDATWPCDDPSDCAAGQVCCNAGTGSACLSPAQCSAMSGRRMCLMMSDCAAGEECCGVGPSPSYYCGNVCPISRRAYKRDIEYLDEASLQRLHDELLRYRLSTYRYRADPDGDPRHLGFIIDDVGSGPAVAGDGEHVDLYGYASMAVAALQVQAREIAALRREVRALQRHRRR